MPCSYCSCEVVLEAQTVFQLFVQLMSLCSVYVSGTFQHLSNHKLHSSARSLQLGFLLLPVLTSLSVGQV